MGRGHGGLATWSPGESATRTASGSAALRDWEVNRLAPERCASSTCLAPRYDTGEYAAPRNGAYRPVDDNLHFERYRAGVRENGGFPAANFRDQSIVPKSNRELIKVLILEYYLSQPVFGALMIHKQSHLVKRSRAEEARWLGVPLVRRASRNRSQNCYGNNSPPAKTACILWAKISGF